MYFAVITLGAVNNFFTFWRITCFEFIQARLALAIGPSPEMAQLVRLHHLGIIAKDFTAKKMAQALGQVDLDQIAFFKENASRVAYEWSAQAVKSVWLDIINGVLCDPDGLG